MNSTAVQFLTGSAAGDRAFGLLVVGLFTLMVLIAVLLAVGADALWARWWSRALRNPPRQHLQNSQIIPPSSPRIGRHGMPPRRFPKGA